MVARPLEKTGVGWSLVCLCWAVPPKRRVSSSEGRDGEIAAVVVPAQGA